MDVLGIVGVGALAQYFVAGLRKSGDTRRILLTPRNKDMAAVIADAFDAEVMADNQSVVDQADIVLLATRPEHSLLALDKLSFRDNQLLLSAVAGVGLQDLEAGCAPAAAARCLPLVPAQVCAGATPLYPADPRAIALMEKMITVVPVEDERQFDLGGVSSCIGGWVYQIVAELQYWLEQAGMQQDAARSLAIETFHGATSLAKANPDLDLQEQANAIGHEGTFTKFFIDEFARHSGIDAFHKSSDALFARFDS